MIWKTRRLTLDLSHQARVMGILNVTPDSFSDGGEHLAVETAHSHALRMIAEGADLIDIGGESTRPGAAAVPEDEEIARTVPVIRRLRAAWDGLISIDTSKAGVAKAALEAGADIVNDVSGLLADAGMAQVCAGSGCGVVVMHMQGRPQTMQAAPRYEDVVAEVRAFFQERFRTLTAAGIAKEALCFDPGIGFGKTLGHNLALLRSLGDISVEERPLLLGVSRKSFIAGILGSDSLTDREWPTVAITANAREKGIMLHRVHAVRPNVEALRMTEAILNGTVADARPPVTRP
ncbi:dihydropteroate synthase [Luteolibacter yonseiensis]|uniref:Dihydropteroate synthase n=1 Tax=Luteolibacter yonseiensis TaxID=1144680 RepID=A0A934R765_9BACT|nr:dihydropteroate synthase [Luteolibacter yonseiensis]MBK1816475.1 dihydropteroate synthase [Luteolibacter yonseiensis]